MGPTTDLALEALFSADLEADFGAAVLGIFLF